MKPRIAILQNSIEGPGSFERLLRHRARLTYSRADRGRPLPSVREFDGLLVLGGPASAYDDSRPILRQIALIESVLASGKPFLGVCLGAQLLAKAAEARVYPGEVAEFGVSHVHLTDAATSDPLFGKLSCRNAMSVFQWHGDTFDLPRDAGLLAEGHVCRHQAFRVGRAWGVQFHIEATADDVRDWLTGPERACYNADVAKRGIDRERLLRSLAGIEEEQRAASESLIAGFLSEVARG